MIHPVPESDPVRYVISSRQMWLPGNYESERAAKYAFRFPNKQLYELQEQINQIQQRPITFEDLQQAYRNTKETNDGQ